MASNKSGFKALKRKVYKAYSRPLQFIVVILTLLAIAALPSLFLSIPLFTTELIPAIDQIDKMKDNSTSPRVEFVLDTVLLRSFKITYEK